MSDNHIEAAKRRVKDAAEASPASKSLKNDSQADQARTTVKDNGNNLLDTLPGRGTE